MNDLHESIADVLRGRTLSINDAIKILKSEGDFVNLPYKKYEDAMSHILSSGPTQTVLDFSSVSISGMRITGGVDIDSYMRYAIVGRSIKNSVITPFVAAVAEDSNGVFYIVAARPLSTKSNFNKFNSNSRNTRIVNGLRGAHTQLK